MKRISLLDILGPVMIGPSSSHTAGAARIGFENFKLNKNIPEEISIKLYNSFADTGLGHKTDIAVLGGALGIYPSDEKIKLAKEYAREKQVKFEITFHHDFHLHPNTAVVETRLDKRYTGVVGYSIGGGRIIIVKKLTCPLEEKPKILEKAVASYTSGLKQETYLKLKSFKDRSKNPEDFFKAICKIEEESSGYRENTLIQEMAVRYEVMEQAVFKGLELNNRSQNGMWGGDAAKVLSYRRSIAGSILRHAISFSLAVAEYNASMGKIVASPTAGSCGVIPGVMVALDEKYHFSSKKMAKALIIAAAFGAIMAGQVELAGAVAGCQAEIGAAAAMAAASGTYILGGNLDQIESSASLALANLIGLTCDPVMGLVEVPCILRNGNVAASVIASIQASLAGVIYPIPFDEVVGVVKEVGMRLPAEYRETSKGGLATTPTALKKCRECGLCS